MKHTKRDQAALELLRSRLDPKHELFAGSDEVEKALTDVSYYFGTHVLPLIDFLLKGEQWFGQANDIVRDYSMRKASARARAGYLERTK